MDLNAFKLLEGVPLFRGKAEELQIFITRIDEVRENVNQTLLRIFDIRIRYKIVSEANFVMINNGSPTNWDDIKKILRENFKVNDNYVTYNHEYQNKEDTNLGNRIDLVKTIPNKFEKSIGKEFDRLSEMDRREIVTPTEYTINCSSDVSASIPSASMNMEDYEVSFNISDDVRSTLDRNLEIFDKSELLEGTTECRKIITLDRMDLIDKNERILDSFGKISMNLSEEIVDMEVNGVNGNIVEGSENMDKFMTKRSVDGNRELGNEYFAMGNREIMTIIQDITNLRKDNRVIRSYIMQRKHMENMELRMVIYRILNWSIFLGTFGNLYEMENCNCKMKHFSIVSFFYRVFRKRKIRIIIFHFFSRLRNNFLFFSNSPIFLIHNLFRIN